MSAAQLRLFQLVSPALPVGAFSYSEGLEVLVQAGRITTPEALETWLRAELERGALGVEAAALVPLAAALGRARSAVAASQEAQLAAALAELKDLDGWLLAARESAELRAQQRQMGQSLLRLLADLGWPLPTGMAAATPAGSPQPIGPSGFAWPAAWAWAGVCLDLPPADLVEAYLYGWVANQISAAVRLVPLGPTQGQRLQLALAPLITERASALGASDPKRLWNGGVGAGLAQLGHRELYSRLFRS
jgi:urease accessory protein